MIFLVIASYLLIHNHPLSAADFPHSLTFTQPACLTIISTKAVWISDTTFPSYFQARVSWKVFVSILFLSICKRGTFGPPASPSKRTAAPAGVEFTSPSLSSNTFIPPVSKLQCALTSIFAAYLHKRQRHSLSMPAGCNYAERHSYLTAGWNCGRSPAST